MKLAIITIVSLLSISPVFAESHFDNLSELYLVGDYAELKNLVAKGVDLDKTDYDGKTALIYASYDGNREIVELLINNGAEVNTVDEDGRTALIYAIWDGDKRIVDLLIKSNSKLEYTDHDGRTPLIWAAMEGQVGIASLLITGLIEEKNAKVADSNGDISDTEKNEIADSITNYVNIADDDGKTALNWASQEGYTDMVKFLIKNKSK